MRLQGHNATRDDPQVQLRKQEIAEASQLEGEKGGFFSGIFVNGPTQNFKRICYGSGIISTKESGVSRANNLDRMYNFHCCIVRIGKDSSALLERCLGEPQEDIGHRPGIDQLQEYNAYCG
jgi:hypothetical protein